MKETLNYLPITSRRNQLLLDIASLGTQEGRESTGLCWAEGAVAAEFALRNGLKDVKAVCLSEGATEKCRALGDRLVKAGAKGYLLTPECFAKASFLKNPEGLGLMVKASKRHEGLENVPEKAKVACLWRLQDPGNMGTILRSARAFGCRNVIVVSPSVSPLSPPAIRASAGAALDMDFYLAKEEEALSYLRSQGKRVCALSGEGHELLAGKQFCYNGTEAIVVSGNEPHGLPKGARETLPLYSIPMEKGVESLNVTAASAIAYFILWTSRQ